MNEELLSRVKMHEGFRERPYYCPAGKLTIGYGWNIEDEPFPEEIAEALLRLQLQRRENMVRAFLGNDWLDLSATRQGVLTELAFNLGWAGLMKFRRMWAAVRHRDWRLAAAEMRDSKWYTQVGDRGEYLARLMENGDD